jgi:hypothetical protein
MDKKALFLYFVIFYVSPNMSTRIAFPFVDLEKCLVSVRCNLGATTFGANIEKAIIRHTIPLLNTANLHDHEEYNNVSDGVHLKLLVPFPHFSNDAIFACIEKMKNERDVTIIGRKRQS